VSPAKVNQANVSPAKRQHGQFRRPQRIRRSNGNWKGNWTGGRRDRCWAARCVI